MAYLIKDRLRFLAGASKILSASLDYNVTLANVAKLITDNMADFCMIDLLDENGIMIRVASRSSSPKKRELIKRMFNFPANPRNKEGIYYVAQTRKSVFVRNLDLKWLRLATISAGEREIVHGLEMNSFIFSPLISRDKVIGVITIISSKEGFSYTDDDVLLAEEIGNRAGIAVDKARLYQEAQEALEAEKALATNFEFLSDASKILSSSLDYKTTLANVAKLSILHIADWCGVDILNDDGEIEQVAVAHRDPAKVKWAKELRKHRPVKMSDPTGVANVLRTGKAEIYSLVTDAMLTAAAESKEELKLLRNLHLTSVMIVPLVADKKTIGTISFITTNAGRQYDNDDLRMAEELANRASLAIENARLYSIAQDAITKREEFMSIAAHELRTPLTIILLHLQKANTDIKKLMEKHTGMEKIPDLLERSEKQGLRLSKLINDLLDVSLGNSGRLTLEKERVDLNALVEEVLQVFSIQMKKAKKSIVFNRSGDPVIGHWDRIRLEQVILNLISNAFKYGKGKPIDVLVTKKTGEALIKIKDKGIGIKPENRKGIFELFKRGVSSNDYKGLGIGLYISGKIVEAHGGWIDVESKVGAGSTFTVRLPLKSH